MGEPQSGRLLREISLPETDATKEVSESMIWEALEFVEGKMDAEVNSVPGRLQPGFLA